MQTQRGNLRSTVNVLKVTEGKVGKASFLKVQGEPLSYPALEMCHFKISCYVRLKTYISLSKVFELVVHEAGKYIILEKQ